MASNFRDSLFGNPGSEKYHEKGRSKLFFRLIPHSDCRSGVVVHTASSDSALSPTNTLRIINYGLNQGSSGDV
jgi:hypothetical protein